MKVGDLVVRIWNGKPLWEMVGIIIEENFRMKDSGGAEWIYSIKWSNDRTLVKGFGLGDEFGSWTSGEIEVINEL